jgi:succinate dehydrogenase/fumarate reductase-like Fe-S protein
MTRKLFAWLNLAWYFGRHIVTRAAIRPLTRGRDLRRFTGIVEPEGYVPLDPAARLEFPRYMNCVQCGLCAIACESLQRQPHSAWDEAWTFVAGASRSIDRTALVVRDMTECAFAASTERVCPMGVPINHMAATIRNMAGPDLKVEE